MRFLSRRPRPAAILAAGLAAALLGAAAVLGPSSVATSATPKPAPGPTATVHQGDTFTGDDNGDGRIDEGFAIAAPLECEVDDASDAVFRLCLTVAAQPAYTWAAANGETVAHPDGHALIGHLQVKPGSEAWANALRDMHAEFRQHGPRT
ncbi:hypothetical protein ABZ468_07660 [Streptomyces sp. NPDC005708]|uniref:hypothetical protein n=1 Tax=Streptomyces sp. NPDC005708 TaxID=3154564 RepID=UPI0033C73475